ncbi:MAG: hypothetical protein QM811_10990 [Pirellulales bacterium]
MSRQLRLRPATFGLLSGLLFVVLTAFHAGSASAADKEFVGRLALLAEPTVATELKLTDDIKTKLMAIIDERENGAVDLALSAKSMPAAEVKTKMEAYRTESELLGLKLLTIDQVKRLGQIEWDRRGPLAFLDPTVAAKLKFTAKQDEQVAEMAKEFEAAVANVPKDARESRKIELERRLIGVLDPAQRTTWEDLTGRKLGNLAAATEVALADVPKTPEPAKVVEPAKGAETAKVESPKTETPATESPKVTEAPKAPVGPRVPDRMTRPAATESDAGGEKKLKFSFKYQPWRDVIEWFAKQSDLSLIMEYPPQGTFNYQDNKSYTPSEALDLLNGVLLTKGYTMVRRERILMVVNLADGVPDQFVETIPLDQLDKRAQYELVRCVFKLEKMAADRASSEIKNLLGASGSVVVLNEARQIVVTDTVGRLRTVRSVIESIENPSSASSDSYKPLTLTHIAPTDALTIIKQLLNIPGDRNATSDGSIRLVIDSSGKSLLIGGKAEGIAKVEEVLKVIDVPSAANGNALAGQPQLEVYSIGAADSTTVLQVLQTLLSGTAETRLSLDPRNGNLIALARPCAAPDDQSDDRTIAKRCASARGIPSADGRSRVGEGIDRQAVRRRNRCGQRRAEGRSRSESASTGRPRQSGAARANQGLARQDGRERSLDADRHVGRANDADFAPLLASGERRVVADGASLAEFAQEPDSHRYLDAIESRERPEAARRGRDRAAKTDERRGRERQRNAERQRSRRTRNRSEDR